MPYTLYLAALTNNVTFTAYASIGAGGAGLPGSFPQFTLSGWFCGLGTFATRNVFQLTTGNSTGDPVFAISISGTQIRLELWQGDAADPANALWDGGLLDYPATPASTLQNVILAVDTLTQTAKCYVNDVAATLDGSSPAWTGSGSIANPGSAPYNEPWLASPELNDPQAVGVGDLWVADVYLDLDVEANRRKFINADLTAPDLGANGQLPIGTSPPIFLHIPTGTATDFANNYGTGGAWTAQGPDWHIDAGCSFPTPPPDSKVLNMDNVRVTSLATESPCTVAQFTTPPGVSPAVGLRWSDTRGKTYGNAVPQELSSDPLSQLQWNRTGYARDRVFELFWSAASKTALNGAFVIVEPWKS